MFPYFNWNSPFEQFIINPIYPLNLIYIDFTISNATIVLFILVLVLFYTFSMLMNFKKKSYNIHGTQLDTQFHLLYIVIQTIIEKHVHVKYYQQIIFPIIFSLGIFLLMLNLGGNLPIFMSLTSQFSIISAFSLPPTFGIFFWFLYERGLTFFRSFHAPGMESWLAAFLFPIELLTFVMRPVSVICRLCSNIMSGHIVVKVCLHTLFAISHTKDSSTVFKAALVFFLSLKLIPLLLLEVIVSVIQVYVFLVIFCMFVSDSIGHHYRH
ncbi:MAG: ATP synthase F0 subunit A [Rickettsiales bacterium]|nr:ATP synthase F0 subunit A [Rickettsiales bacterium]